MTCQFRREKLAKMTIFLVKSDSVQTSPTKETFKILAIFILFLASFLNNSLLLLRRKSKEG